jgi:hypothetical protein
MSIALHHPLLSSILLSSAPHITKHLSTELPRVPMSSSSASSQPFLFNPENTNIINDMYDTDEESMDELIPATQQNIKTSRVQPYKFFIAFLIFIILAAIISLTIYYAIRKSNSSDNSTTWLGEFGILLTGQAILRQRGLFQLSSNGNPYWPLQEYEILMNLIEASDFVVTDAEFTCESNHFNNTADFAPTRYGPSAQFLHVVNCSVLHTLSHELMIHSIACANNHAWDLSIGGIESMMFESQALNHPCIGLGHNSRSAAEIRSTLPLPDSNTLPPARLHLISFASGAVNSSAVATVDQPGVNTLQINPQTLQINQTDLQRQYSSISTKYNSLQQECKQRQNCENAQLFGLIHHNHVWDNTDLENPDYSSDYSIEKWRIQLAHDMLDNSAADFYASHGKPALLAVEIYRNQPIFYGLGNLFFQTNTALNYWPPAAWRGCLVKLNYGVKAGETAGQKEGNKFPTAVLRSILFMPYTLLNNEQVLGTEYRGLPVFARNISYSEQYEILHTLQQQSKQMFNTSIIIYNRTARLFPRHQQLVGEIYLHY